MLKTVPYPQEENYSFDMDCMIEESSDAHSMGPVLVYRLGGGVSPQDCPPLITQDHVHPALSSFSLKYGERLDSDNYSFGCGREKIRSSMDYCVPAAAAAPTGPHLQFNLGECPVDAGLRTYVGMEMSCFASWKTEKNQTMYLMKGSEEERWDSIGRFETRSNVFRCFRMGSMVEGRGGNISNSGSTFYISQGVKNTCLGHNGKPLTLDGNGFRDMVGKVTSLETGDTYDTEEMLSLIHI